MRKIPTLFVRDMTKQPALVTPEVAPGLEWVAAGEGVATKKLDGTCCLVRDGKLYKRREVRAGETVGGDFEMCEFDGATGKTFGWVPVSETDPQDKWHREALKHDKPLLSDGTYELIGPKIQGNPESEPDHRLVRHGQEEILDAPRTFEALRQWFVGKDIEGLVWHAGHGRMAKIKKKDFGLKRKD